MASGVEQELKEATERILQSDSRKKLVVAGPGAGKTYLFKKLLEASPGGHNQRLVLTFLSNLANDLKESLGDLAQTYTLHGYCQHLLHRHAGVRGGLSSEFECYPGLASLIKRDWEWIRDSEAPKFVEEMRHLNCSNKHEAFYLGRANYYDAVDFDDSVYRTFRRLNENPDLVPQYELVLVDEFQDFNNLEAGIIDLLADRNAIVIAGDDDQALYSKLRSASWDYIRSHFQGDDYEVFPLPFCMRCTEVIVGAVGDIIRTARAHNKLQGRIVKPYRFYEPHKGEDSRRYPKIDVIRTSVQKGNVNYFGRYIEKVIRAIPEADAMEANANNEPLALIIGSRPYLPQVEKHLIDVGLILPREPEDLSAREQALNILRGNPESNLGWRIILECGDESVAAGYIRRASKEELSLFEVMPDAERRAVLQEAEAIPDVQENKIEAVEVPHDTLNIKLTSYEGSKGLAAQHVFLVGLHAGELPRNPAQVEDIEICKFLVGLTRTKKKCSLMLTGRFAGIVKRPSPFLRWIDREKCEWITVNKEYWDGS